MKVRISIKNLSGIKDIKIDVAKSLCVVNGKTMEGVDISRFVVSLQNTIATWKREYVGPQVVDGESFSIVIDNAGRVRKYIGSNLFPANYRVFKDLLLTLEAV